MEKLHSGIHAALIETVSLEDLKISVGAIPSVVTQEQQNIRSSSEISIVNRVSGINPRSVTPAYPHKYKMKLHLGKLSIDGQIVGVVVFQRFEDCRGCIKRSGCDAFETGSLLLKDTMFSGYTNQDVAYQEATGLFSGNCTYRFQRHNLSEKPINIYGMLLMQEVGQMQEAIHNQPVSWENFPDSVHASLNREHMQKMMLYSKMKQVNSATVCAQFIMDAYSDLHGK